jgi:flagellar basal-body rod protein FlgG
MMRALYTAATGMAAQQLNVDTIANNLANVNTAGFKKSRVDFQDLLYQQIRIAGASSSDSTQVPTGISVGLGVRPASTQRLFTDGLPKLTERRLDVRIDGDGFFQIQLPDGDTGYTRDGSFKLDDQRRVVNSDGYLLEPSITIPENVPDSGITIAPDGTVQVKVTGESTMTDVGQVTLASFVNPQGLTSVGGNLYKTSPASGEATVGNPNSEGRGALVQGMLEMSNVAVIDEMVDLITAQRAYDVNSKSIQTSDEMLGLANNLKR